MSVTCRIKDFIRILNRLISVGPFNGCKSIFYATVETFMQCGHGSTHEREIYIVGKQFGSLKDWHVHESLSPTTPVLRWRGLSPRLLDLLTLSSSLYVFIFWRAILAHIEYLSACKDVHSCVVSFYCSQRAQ